MIPIIAIVVILLVLTVGVRATRSLLGGARDERRSVDQYGRAIRTLQTLPERAATDEPGNSRPGGDGGPVGDHLAGSHVAEGPRARTGRAGGGADEHPADGHIGGSHIGGSHIGGRHIGSRHIGSSHIGSSHIGSSHIGSSHIASSDESRLADGIGVVPGRTTFRADALPRSLNGVSSRPLLGTVRALTGSVHDDEQRLPGLASLVASDAPWPVQEAARIIGVGEDRHDRDPAVEANARLTGTTGLLLIVLFFLEGLTIPLIHSLVSWHILIGLVLIPPLAVKMGSTMWRFGHYYLRDQRYRQAGPPHPLLRMLGPVVLASTVVLFASGVGLWIAGPSNHTLFRIHQVSFVLWFIVVAVHVAAHLLRATRLAAADAHDASRTARSVAPAQRNRARRRRALVATSLVVGLIVGFASSGAVSSSSWNHLGTRTGTASGTGTTVPGG